jgi:hypothetical protein
VPRIVSSAHSSSPLWLVTNEPHVNELVSYLDTMRRRIEASPDEIHVFEFSRLRLTDVRTAFARMIRHGEEQLHRVLRADVRDLPRFHLHAPERRESARVETTKERFTLGEEHLAGRSDSQTDPRSRHPAAAGACAITTAARGAAPAWSPTSSSTSRPG